MREYSNYNLQYSGRFANELKLEAVDYDDFSSFCKLLRLYLTMPTKKTVVDTKGSIRLPLIDRFYVTNFKRYGENREEFRLLRSNFFAILRKLNNRMGGRYFGIKWIDRKEYRHILSGYGSPTQLQNNIS